ncbi:neurogenic locus notch homolog protein 1-like isoform X2 [Acanthaster planci]|uniref:Neurogenic locus notch homolog protein 1-like isoform X2 n=1 Tax=Acanthaster planci TaxID=133434 RepID=A0A8B7Y670_ACAPL|nr:neurogenic locus notch homolog protein 1-like isoform X2 [Acanthaster planci]
MKLLVTLCVLAGFGTFTVQGTDPLCNELGDITNPDPCANCTCVMNPTDPSTGRWFCVQTCPVCPTSVLSTVCLLNFCTLGPSCELHPDATCKISDCNDCDSFAWYKDGNLVNCTHKPGMCPVPEGLGPCVNMCVKDMDCPDSQKCCSNGCGKVCSHPLNACASSPCANGGVCYTAASNPSAYVCSCQDGFTGNDCETDLRMPRDPCPADQPFMNCTYEDVCSSLCSAAPSARCLVDHCGGCRPVYIGPLGNHVNCTSGQVSDCPPGVEMVNCLVDPCDNAQCPADPMARCVSVYCGKCKAVFVNDQGYHVNCTSGEASVCPPGMVENPVNTPEACMMATCPAHPRAQCLAKKCLWPNVISIECPYQFFDARARPVMCERVKQGRCPRVEFSEVVVGICLNECMDDTDCEGNKKCCMNACGGRVCRDPEMDMEGGKPGTCPMPPMDSFGICVDSCMSDDDCEGRAKCCSNGCGHTCVDPEEQPGECPARPDHMMLLASPQHACSNDSDCSGHRSKCCAYGCGQICVEPVTVVKPGMCPMPDPDAPAGICSELCSGDVNCTGSQKCCSNGCGHTCQEPADELPMPRDPCPADQPFMNCTYEDVCSSLCSAAPSARCLVDHCGGCRPVYIGSLGNHVNCTTGQVLNCPPGVEMVNCLVDPCDNAQCPADPMARCVSVYCGKCKAVFVNDQGYHVNCTSGEASFCPPGMVENPVNTPEACMMATCPAHPRAQCLAKKCLWPNVISIECPYQFFDARARPVMCERVKQGRCPRIESSESSLGICLSECMDDVDCEGNAKCCMNACGGRVCRDPEMDMEETMNKPGTCPQPTMGSVGICVDECNPHYGDAGCPQHWKCCNNGCGHVCTAPREMPGQCPMVSVEAGEDNCEEECTSDMDCYMEEPGTKCCSYGCGTRCMRPVTGRKPGTCPMPPMDSFGICVDSCMSDDDCEGRAKCCSNGCGHACVDPEEQPGECPARPDHMMLLASPQHACSNDSDCSGHRSKCCAYGCGQICVEPVTVVKPGMCPMPDPDAPAGICSELCSGDVNCTGSQKCCSNGCGHTCQEPAFYKKPGMCPMVREGVSGICMEMCSEDRNCSGVQKCCSNGCGHTCQEPVLEKPGMCPVPDVGIIGLCVEMCDGDKRCPGREKCCSNGCGHTCQEPVEFELVCPMPNPGVTGICLEACSGDEDCPAHKMCCSNGCGHTCVEPVHKKAGMCPMMEPGVSGICVEMCREDRNCSGWKKCCSNGCGHTCQEPIYEKPGMCPMPGQDFVGICTEMCNGDRSCPGGKKCCSNGCGHTCQEPVVLCEDGELAEVCEFNPCQFATCPSMPSAICIHDKCGQCRPKFFLGMEEVNCAGNTYCDGLGDDNELYETGAIVDSSNGCDQCVCTEQKLWKCSNRRCGKLYSIYA